MAETGLTPNFLLRDARNRVELSREELADACNQVPSMAASVDGPITANFIAKLEQGRIHRPRTSERCQALRTVLGVATDAEIGLTGARRRPTDQPRTVDQPSASHPSMVQTSWSDNQRSQPRDRLDLPSARRIAEAGPESDLSNREGDEREVLGEAQLADMDLVELLAVLEYRGISNGALTAAELTAERLDRRFARLGPDETMARVRGLMESAVQQLRMPQPLRHQRRLVALVARLAGLRAWGCFDLDQLSEAQRWYDVAIMAARDAEAWSLGAWLLGAQSLIPWHRRDRQQTVAIVERGIYFAGRGTDSTTLAWLHALHARGRASLGDLHGFEAAHELAERAADHSSERDRRHGMDFDQGVLDVRYYAGTGRLLLQQPDEAATSLRGSLASLPDTHTKAKAVLTIAVAEAAVQAGDLDHAVALTRSALAATRHQPIMPILQQARRIRRQMQQRTPMNDLDEELNAFAGALNATAARAEL